ncbi:ankyrin repeat domain-containing protein [Brevibacillus sp. BC25]|uniref:ankyrin repeat domain-containing protein n=1 Tax=Brevibacillus sp. BC25 TaxID=1144308 RepID=UPI0002714F17|nr:ankyrin repeat domain-containing protein [Brevibacillus sp. BC25]EJL25876.1 ankyrin repeat-containing protein [Brevibacillus sp. BC25]
MSIKMKRSLLLASVLVICVAIWTIVIQNMTGSNQLSKPVLQSSIQQQKADGVRIEDLEPKDIQEHPNQQKEITNNKTSYDVSKDEGTNVLSDPNHIVPGQVEEPTINTPDQPEVSMNLDYEHILRLDPNVKIVAISDDKMASEEARQARQELEASVPQFNAFFFVDAARENEIDILKLFLKAGIDPNAYIEVEKGFKTTALHSAVSNDHLDVASLLLKNGANPNLLYDQYTIITLAVAKNNYDMVNELLKNGAEPDLNYQNFRSPLMRAVQDNRLHIVKLLLEYGADPLLATQYAPEHPSKLSSPIAEARMLGNREMIALLEAFIPD